MLWVSNCVFASRAVSKGLKILKFWSLLSLVYKWQQRTCFWEGNFKNSQSACVLLFFITKTKQKEGAPLLHRRFKVVRITLWFLRINVLLYVWTNGMFSLQNVYSLHARPARESYHFPLTSVDVRWFRCEEYEKRCYLLGKNRRLWDCFCICMLLLWRRGTEKFWEENRRQIADPVGHSPCCPVVHE